jgi:hypothetical protein
MKCEKEELIAKACSTLVAHIGEGQMINNTRKPEQKKKTICSTTAIFQFFNSGI